MGVGAVEFGSGALGGVRWIGAELVAGVGVEVGECVGVDVKSVVAGVGVVEAGVLEWNRIEPEPMPIRSPWLSTTGLAILR